MTHYITNINVRGRFTQVVIMVTVILGVMLASQFAHARGYNKMRYEKSKYRIAVHKNSHRTCYILFKKRTSIAKHPGMSAGRRGKSKAQAET